VDNKKNSAVAVRCETEDAIAEALEGVAGALPHICVAGVSNAGKSSMINHLIVKKNLAKASSIAGKTNSVDMFIVNDAFVLTDFPGMPSTDPQVDGMWRGKWRPLIKAYMSKVPDLRAFIYVHDIRWPIAPDEVGNVIISCEMLVTNGVCKFYMRPSSGQLLFTTMTLFQRLSLPHG